jgi:two-component system sensor histidine kinase DesK
VLAWCLREAVTNVIRHSGAKSCRIRLTERPGELSLEVTDDGRGPGPRPRPDAPGPDAPGPDAPGPDAAAGAGLHGMSERLSAVGGRLTLGPGSARHLSQGHDENRGRGFTLTATVPVERYDD